MIGKLKKNNKGFTIIEVLIVLAIAGLILLIVFLAVPALQRSSRNTQRKSDISHLGGIIGEYVANNQGTPPTAISAGTGTTAGTLYTGTEKFGIENIPTATGGRTPSPGIAVTPLASGGALATLTLNTPVVYSTATCSGNTPTGGASTRSLVIYYSVESAGGDTPLCQPV